MLRHIIITMLKAKPKRESQKQQQGCDASHRSILSKIDSRFLIRNRRPGGIWGDIFKLLKEKAINQEFYILQKAMGVHF